MVDLEYLIIYTSEGTPVYSRCFANLCKMTLQDDTLLSAFLSALNQFAEIDPDNVPKQMQLGNEMVNIKTKSSRVNSIKMEDLELLFHYVTNEDLTIAVGTGIDDAENIDSTSILSDLTIEVEQFYETNYNGTDWRDVKRETLVDMEQLLLSQVVHPFFDRYNMDNSCPMGDECPFRQALYDGEGEDIFSKIYSKLGKIRTTLFG